MEVLAAEELNAVESNGVPSVLRTRHWTRTVSIRGWTMRQMDRSAASRTSLRTVSHFLSRHTPDYAVHIVWKAQLSDKRASKRVHQSPSHTLPAANRAAASYSKSRVEGLVETNDAAICRQKANSMATSNQTCGAWEPTGATRDEVCLPWHLSTWTCITV